MPSEQHGLIFLPFLRLKQTHTVAGVSFVPLRQEDGQVPAALMTGLAAIERILSGYVDRHGEAFTNCVVAVTADKGWDLSEDDFDRVNYAASLLFLASWSKNRYFSRFDGHYVNASSFRLIGQRFQGVVPGYIAISARRRDGSSMDGGYRHGDFKFNVPVQCSVGHFIEVDVPFLDALNQGCVQNAAVIGRLRTALPFVLLANTDDDFMLAGAEAVLMGSAFEQLFRADASAYRLTKKLGEAFKDFGRVRVSDALGTRTTIRVEPAPKDQLAWRVWRRLSNVLPRAAFVGDVDLWLAQRSKAAQMGWWLHRKWVEELYDLRSRVVHRGGTESRTWGWTIFEHLVMAAHVFPLAVKRLLEESRFYQFTDDDRAACLTIDPILRSVRWVDERDEDDGVAQSWHATLRRVRKEVRWECVQQQVNAKYVDSSDEGGTTLRGSR